MWRGRVATSGGWGAVMELQKRSSNGAPEEELVLCTANHSVRLSNGAPQSHQFRIPPNLRFLRIGVRFFELRNIINDAPFLLISLYFF